MRLIILTSLILITACSGVRSPAVVPVQSKDKQLTCREMVLEMNEAEQYKVAAEKNKNPDMRAFIAPLGYVYTMTSASEAIDASEKRIGYLKEVYNISGCNGSASTLDPNQLRGHTFGSGYPTPTPQQR